MDHAGNLGPTLLERVDLALATCLVDGDRAEPLANAQLVLDGVRTFSPDEASFCAAMLRLRGFPVGDEVARRALGDERRDRAKETQEVRMIHGLANGLQLVRARVASGRPPDGWFAVDLWKQMTAELPRFRNNDIRRGPPWDSVLYMSYPAPDQLPFLLDRFDLEHSYRDQPLLFAAMHPVRQGFRILWRFARIAPFPDFNLLMGWMLMVAWLQWKGYPLLPPAHPDQVLMARLLSGPPPHRIVQLESRLLDMVERLQQAG